MDPAIIKRTLISVSDKTGIVEFAKAIAGLGVEIVSTGGTAKALAEAGLTVRTIDELTGFPEMMEGRVKTLHPNVHGGLLARRDKPEHMRQAAEHGIGMIDMIVVNLYPFEATVAREGVSEAEAIEQIDIGGPSMLRSAAKNFASVTVVTDPADYEPVLEEMRANGGATKLETRRRLAVQAFAKTSAYDAAILAYLQDGGEFPPDLRFRLLKQQDLRYGENPHQRGAFYRFADAKEHTLARAEQLHGKALSYNNLLDSDAAWAAVREFEQPACVIVKHLNPCGTAVAADATAAYDNAYASDPASAYGGVMAFNREVPRGVAEHIGANGQFVEVMIAPGYDPAALELLQQKKNVRLLRTGGLRPTEGHYESRGVDGGMLVQTSDAVAEDPSTFRVVTKRQPSAEELEQLLFAWTVAKTVKSNAIVLCKDFASVGVGAGQMSRVDSAEIAVKKAGAERAKGSVCGSDAFMPFPDALEVVAAAGATAVIQPGGSIRDEEVIAAADAHGIAMVFTGVRHFRH
ncbi:MAG TPA: bifunctional phosphoribosylaminoimidazolecarboxamide formyltransferase/IMP cyclohydrolase [Coriobacteriia bacterium]